MTGVDEPVPADDRAPGDETLNTHPALDVATAQAAVVIQNRAVVGASAWLLDAVQAAVATGRRLQLVTPGGSRLTLPLRTLLSLPGADWVVRARDGYHDGLTGRRLEWISGAFGDRSGGGTPADLAPDFLPAATNGYLPVAAAEGLQLAVTAHVRHPIRDRVVLGGAVECLCSSLAGAPPAGWGPAEPVTTLWRVEDLTAMARNRSPRPAWLVFVGGRSGRPTVGTLRVESTRTSVSEHLTMAVGYPGTPDLAALTSAVAALAARQCVGSPTLVQLLAHVQPGREDLTYPPQWEGLPMPVAIAVGPEALAAYGLSHALAPQLRGAKPFGPAERPVVHYPLTHPDRPGEPTPYGWESLRLVLAHLRVGR
jgi:hypothetical protein